MFNRKWYEWMLTATYVAMIVLCFFLNFTPGHQESMATIIVNGIMFIIVGLTFLNADINRFAPMNNIIVDLEEATDKIRKDAMNTHAYLWEPYQSGNVELFSNEMLKDMFQDFLFNLNRNEGAQGLYYRSNIDDYINEDIVDDVMHRNELNQVAGMLTGLGILGTFIGLSLGLQSFNTGTTAEMTSSIEPLMNGIKVAFHTSIYGMVFSLVFNAIYKKKLYEAERAVNNFIAAFKKYVLPDTDNDGMNRLLELQEEQLDAINNISANVSEELAAMVEPHFDSLHDVIVDFENMATRSQQDAMGQVVQIFIDGMNRALEDTFKNLAMSVEEQYRLQQRNSIMMNSILESTGKDAQNLDRINHEMERLITTLNNYTQSIQAIQDAIGATISELNKANESSKNMVSQELMTLKEQETLLTGFQNAVIQLYKNTDATKERMTEALDEISDAIDLMRQSLDRQQAKNVRR